MRSIEIQLARPRPRPAPIGCSNPELVCRTIRNRRIAPSLMLLSKTHRLEIHVSRVPEVLAFSFHQNFVLYTPCGATVCDIGNITRKKSTIHKTTKFPQVPPRFGCPVWSLPANLENMIIIKQIDNVRQLVSGSREAGKRISTLH